MILWAAHDGGYDADTWYWGALVTVGLLAAVLSGLGTSWMRLPRALRLALIAFAMYVAWSYLSIAWAASPGDAWSGSNRALLYLVVFALFAFSRWSVSRAMVILLVYVLGIAAIGAVLLISMATGHDPASLFTEGRLVSPTGYFNSNTALFTTGAFVAVGLAGRRELPRLMRGFLLAIACAGLQLALLGESRGWLFTLPFMLIAAVALLRDRLPTAAFAILPIAAGLANLPRLLDVFKATDVVHPTQKALVTAATHAGRASLLACAVVLILGTLLAAADVRLARPSLSTGRRRLIGTAVITVALAAAIAGGLSATGGHPIRFVKRQWHGFTHPSSRGSRSGSHFAVVGSGRYDAWRVSLDALSAHPIGGLGQDNFADYYVRHRRTDEELSWTHSFEFRLIAHTGLVGLVLMAMFLAAGLTGAIGNRRKLGGLAGAVAGVSLLPLAVWLIHGSVDWFWEIPALSGPALGFLAMAAALEPARAPESSLTKPSPSRPRRLPRGVPASVGLLAVFAAVVVLGFPYLSVREVSAASQVRRTNPGAALHDLAAAARMNPLSSTPGRLAGTIAIQSGNFIEAERRFRQAISREPGGWFSWLGAGLAASALGDTARARRDFAVAASINSRQRAVTEALARVDSRHPLTAPEAFRLFVLAH